MKSPSSASGYLRPRLPPLGSPFLTGSLGEAWLRRRLTNYIWISSGCSGWRQEGESEQRLQDLILTCLPSTDERPQRGMSAVMRWACQRPRKRNYSSALSSQMLWPLCPRLPVLHIFLELRHIHQDASLLMGHEGSRSEASSLDFSLLSWQLRRWPIVYPRSQSKLLGSAAPWQPAQSHLMLPLTCEKTSRH